MSEPTRAVILKCKRSFNELMERAIEMPDQDFMDYLKFLGQMIDYRREYVLCTYDENEVAESPELPEELRQASLE